MSKKLFLLLFVFSLFVTRNVFADGWAISAIDGVAGWFTRDATDCDGIQPGNWSKNYKCSENKMGDLDTGDQCHFFCTRINGAVYKVLTIATCPANTEPVYSTKDHSNFNPQPASDAKFIDKCVKTSTQNDAICNSTNVGIMIACPQNDWMLKCEFSGDKYVWNYVPVISGCSSNFVRTKGYNFIMDLTKLNDNMALYLDSKDSAAQNNKLLNGCYVLNDNNRFCKACKDGYVYDSAQDKCIAQQGFKDIICREKIKNKVVVDSENGVAYQCKKGKDSWSWETVEISLCANRVKPNNYKVLYDDGDEAIYVKKDVKADSNGLYLSDKDAFCTGCNGGYAFSTEKNRCVVKKQSDFCGATCNNENLNKILVCFGEEREILKCKQETNSFYWEPTDVRNCTEHSDYKSVMNLNGNKTVYAKKSLKTQGNWAYISNANDFCQGCKPGYAFSSAQNQCVKTCLLNGQNYETGQIVGSEKNCSEIASGDADLRTGLKCQQVCVEDTKRDKTEVKWLIKSCPSGIKGTVFPGFSKTFYQKCADAGLERAKEKIENFFDDAKRTASGWKNAEGKFNTMRLASDITAGVVLGTVGGVVSGVVIKKKQIEKGFEVLHCTVGGQNVADWGDEFSVGLNSH